VFEIAEIVDFAGGEIVLNTLYARAPGRGLEKRGELLRRDKLIVGGFE
jgi:hypothetical protein